MDFSNKRPNKNKPLNKYFAWSVQAPTNVIIVEAASSYAATCIAIEKLDCQLREITVIPAVKEAIEAFNLEQLVKGKKN